MDLKDAVDWFLQDREIADRSPATVRYYDYVLNRFLNIKTEASFDNLELQIRAYLFELTKGEMAPSSVHTHFRGLRSFSNWAKEQGWCNEPVAQSLQDQYVYRGAQPDNAQGLLRLRSTPTCQITITCECTFCNCPLSFWECHSSSRCKIAIASHKIKCFLPVSKLCFTLAGISTKLSTPYLSMQYEEEYVVSGSKIYHCTSWWRGG